MLKKMSSIFVYVFIIGYLCIFFVEKSIQISRSCLKWAIYLLIIELQELFVYCGCESLFDICESLFDI